MSLMFAATYPERTSAVVLCGTYASIRAEPWVVTREQFEAYLGVLEAHWGEGILVLVNAPSRVNDKAFVQWFARLERATASPGAILALSRANYEIDVRHLLPSVQAPTLILHRKGDALVPVDAGRYLAQHIPGAKYVELPGDDHLLQAYDRDVLDLLLDEIEELMTGALHRPEPDRVLATVLFTDIVGSTDRVSALGDHKWMDLLEAHNELAKREIDRFRGRAVKNTGDGMLATFDGPGRAIRCAQAISSSVNNLGIKVRAGLHTGECELLGADVGGIAVHIAARVASLAGADEVFVSSTVKDLVAGSGIQFEARGAHTLKGVAGEWVLFKAQA